MKWLENLTTELPVLASGSHTLGDGENQACLMELISIMEGETFGDSPKCVSDILQQFGMILNDVFLDDIRNDLLRFAPMLVGTKVRDHLTTSVFKTDYEYTLTQYHDPFTGRDAFVDNEQLRKQIIIDLAVTWTNRYPMGTDRKNTTELRRLATVQLDFDGLRKLRGFDNQFEKLQHAAIQVVASTLIVSQGDKLMHQRLASEALGALEAAIKVGPHTPEMTGWLDVDHQLKAVQWVAEYA